MAPNKMDEGVLYTFYNLPANRAVLAENSIYQALFFAENAMPQVQLNSKILASLILMSNTLILNSTAQDQFRLEYNKFFNVNIEKDALRLTMSSITPEIQDEFGLYQRKPKFK